MNQRLYTSPEWRKIRNLVILRDNGCDLGIEGLDLSRSRILIHHINPITEFDVVNRTSCIFDLENLISISHTSHNYVHFGIKENELSMERKPNDTCPWRR